MTRQEALLVAGLMAGIAVAALDTTVVGTAMPTIIGELGGIESYGWVFSAYLLTATTTVPVFAALADVHGRKPIFLIGLALFVGGSMLSGLSGSMLQLIVFRAIQGVGAGAVQPIAFTIIGDVFEPTRRARMQGYFSSVWGVSAIIGPALGGLITASVGWQWVFFVNVPVGLVAGLIIGFTLREHVNRREHQLDWVGSVALTAGIALLLLGMTEGSGAGFATPAVLGMLLGAVALVGFFVWHERRVTDPIINFELLRRPIIGAGLAITALAGVVMFGVTAYVPPLIQGVHGGTPVEAGLGVGAMSIAWVFASIAAGRAMLRFGTRPVVLAGTGLLVVGSALLTQGPRVEPLWFHALSTAIVGLGMGSISTPVLVSIQSVVAWVQRGQATGLVQFSRTIGGAVGTGLMGAILAASVGQHASAILDPIGRGSIPPDDLEIIHARLVDGLWLIFMICLVVAVAAWLLALRFMPAMNVASHEADADLP